MLYRKKIFSGECRTTGRKDIRVEFIEAGILDSVLYSDKKGRLRAKETFIDEFSTYNTYYKNGRLKRLISFKDDRPYGAWREYFTNGKIKYEAEYGDNAEIINDTYYTWDKKGQKYMHTDVETVKEKRWGKLLFQSSYKRQKKIKVKDS